MVAHGGVRRKEIVALLAALLVMQLIIRQVMRQLSGTCGGRWQAKRHT